MEHNNYKERTKNIIELAKQKGTIKSYETFCEEENSKNYSLLQEDIEYYSSLPKLETPKFQMGDIVFVSKYTYIRTIYWNIWKILKWNMIFGEAKIIAFTA